MKIKFEDYRLKYESFTLRDFIEFCGGEVSMWECYFSGELDTQSERFLLQCINPQMRAAASMTRASIVEMRKILEELKAMKP